MTYEHKYNSDSSYWAHIDFLDVTGKWIKIDLEKEEVVTGLYIVTDETYFYHSTDDWTVWVSNNPTIEDTIAD